MKIAKGIQINGEVQVCSQNKNETICIGKINSTEYGRDHAWIPKQVSPKLMNVKVGDKVSFIADTNPYADDSGVVKLGFKKIRNLIVHSSISKMKIVKKADTFDWVEPRVKTSDRGSVFVSITKGKSEKSSTSGRLMFNFSKAFSLKYNLSEEYRIKVGFDIVNEKIAIVESKDGFKVSANNKNREGGATSYKISLTPAANILNIVSVKLTEEDVIMDNGIIILSLKGKI